MNKINLIEENYKIWTKSPFDKETISNVKDLKKKILRTLMILFIQI